MPASSIRLRGPPREISGATRAFFYSLLDNTASDFALVPPRAAHDSLCSSCSRIPFDEIFCTTDNDTNITFDIGTFSEIEHRRDCVFCSFVKNVCLVAFPWHWIRRFQSYPEQFKIIGGPSAWRTFLDVPPSELISPCATLRAPKFSDEHEEYYESFLLAWLLCYVPSPVRLRTKGEVINGELDVDLIKSWVTACTTNHNICKQMLSIPELHTYVRPNFIDVITKTLVPGEKVTNYVALSYVWGPDEPEAQCRHEETGAGEIVLSNHPRYALRNSKHLVLSHPCQVVKDAAELVMKIGFRYLWVDEYCIGQGPRQREIHISQMDRIYEGAVLTICALSGTHKHLGLPGISSPLQVPPQPYVDLDSKRIIATRLSDPRDDANSSPWNQRAWTLQEASLSRRLLCFTDQSVFWVCQERMFHDAINCLDLGLEGSVSISPSKSFMDFPFHLDEFDGRFNMSAFRSILLSYTRRHLTKDSDALAAISGLLARITKLTGEEFCFGHPKRDLIQSLVWMSEFSHRRKDFPSWSWLGWKGTISLIMWQENHPDVSQPDIFLIDIDDFESNRYYVVEKRMAKVIEYPEEKSTSPILKISSQVARFEVIKVVRKGEDFRDSNEEESGGTSTASDDLWCLNIAHSHDLPCTHAGVGRAFTHSGCFTVDPETSPRLEDVSCQVEFVLLVHWQEYIKDKDSSWVALETNYLLTEDDSEVGNLVLALLILKNQDGKAERIALVPIPYESWAAASPEEMFIELV